MPSSIYLFNYILDRPHVVLIIVELLSKYALFKCMINEIYIIKLLSQKQFLYYIFIFSDWNINIYQ
jgi:hypothetical protein